MRRLARAGAALMALLVIAGCQATATVPAELPPEVTQRLPRGTDPATVRQGPDGCYWYLRAGPLESTFVPLRDRASVPICQGQA